jgi:hypothetical protein
MKGIVGRIPVRGLKNFGFIHVLREPGDERVPESVFYHFESVVQPDALGRTRPLLFDELEFDLATRADGKVRAENIMNLSAQGLSSVSWREWSWITAWKPEKDGALAVAFLERENGDSIALFQSNILNFNEVKENIRTGLWVYHGVAQDEQERWFATKAEIHFPDSNEVESSGSPESFELEPLDDISQHFVNVEKPPLDEKEPEPVSLFSPENRVKTLRQLIAEKKFAA